jgi:hypothetical protein
MMAKRDLTMSDGDNVLGADGNYVTTETASGKMYRCLMSKLGRWAATAHDPTLEFGRNYRDRAKWSEADEQEWMADTEDCFQDLVRSGDIRDVSVEKVAGTDRGSPRFRITATDTRTNDKITLDPDPASWGN